MSAAGRTVIAGLGNVLCSDDGSGVAAARHLAARRPDLDIHEIGTAALHGAALVAGADTLVLLDAIQRGAPPGTIHRLEGPALGAAVGARDVHGLGLLRALALSGLPAPARVVALGIEPGALGYGEALSPAVAAAVPELARLAEREAAGAGVP